MKEVLDLIEQKKEELAKSPFLEYLQDKRIEPRKRLVWAPCMVFFVMFFGELNKDLVFKKNADNYIQEIINQHSREDSTHFIWFLEDMEKMGFNHPVKFTDTLTFLWSEETKKTRHLCYQLFRLCYTYTDPVLRLILIEALEATSHVGLPIISQVATELEKINQEEYHFFGSHHINEENNHSIDTDDVSHIIENISITEEQKEIAYQIIEKVFHAFTEVFQEWMNYAQRHSIYQSITSCSIPETDVWQFATFRDSQLLGGKTS
ncbi:MAG: hypothetical protein QNJ51_16880 [Calothrix sp. MO_167.B12]|nr:hypothetical protein [Calothrix sp. MO_167.B12]